MTITPPGQLDRLKSSILPVSFPTQFDQTSSDAAPNTTINLNCFDVLLSGLFLFGSDPDRFALFF